MSVYKIGIELKSDLFDISFKNFKILKVLILAYFPSFLQVFFCLSKSSGPEWPKFLYDLVIFRIIPVILMNSPKLNIFSGKPQLYFHSDRDNSTQVVSGSTISWNNEFSIKSILRSWTWSPGHRSSYQCDHISHVYTLPRHRILELCFLRPLSVYWNRPSG